MNICDSYYEATARARMEGMLDPGSFLEWLGPAERVTSPHLDPLGLLKAFDDGIVIGCGALDGRKVFVAAQEGGFMGGAVGEVHGAKLTGLLRRASVEKPAAVLLMLETGGVRLQEANAGLIAVSEVMRAILAARGAGVPVIVAIGGQFGCFGGMGIAARCATAIVMSEEARLGLSGPEVIETANGVEEFDARDRALVWRTLGGKHRYLIGECDVVVPDSIEAFRHAVGERLQRDPGLCLASLEKEHGELGSRLEHFGGCDDARAIWAKLGWEDPENVPMLEPVQFMATATRMRSHG